MRTLFIGRKEIRKQPVDYYLLTDEFENFCENYGVQISCAGGEASAVRGLTISQNKILLLLSTLMKYAVTPTTLQDVVDDWLLN